MAEPLPTTPASELFPEDATPPLTQTERVVNTFFAPTKTFMDIRRNRSCWLPFLLVAIFGYLFTTVAIHRIGVDGLAESALRSNPKRYEQMQAQPPEQRQRAMAITRSIMQVSFAAFPVYQLIFSLIFGLLLWGGFNFLLGGSGTFGGMFAVTMFAALPGIFRSLLSTGTLFLTDPDSFNISEPIGTNPGYYLSPDSAAWLRSLLGSFDLFTLWTLLLCGLGGAIVSRVKPASGYALVFGAWLLFVLLKVGLAAATA